MKKRLKKMNLKFIVSSYCLLFCWCLSAQTNTEGVSIDKIIAKVDDFIILKSELEQSYLSYLSRGDLSNTPDRCEILQQLVVNKMLVAQSEIDSIFVSEEEVNSNLDRRMSVMAQQFGGETEIIRAYGKSIEQIRAEIYDNIKEQLTIERMQSELTSSLKVTPAEVRKFFKNIPRDSLPYFSTEVSVAQIVKDIQPGDVQKNKVINLLNDVRNRIIKGESFAEMAKLYSQDPGSAARGGVLSFFSRGELAPEYEATALSLSPGEISEPVETQFGIHIIELLEKRGNSYNSRHILIIPKPNEDDFLNTEKELADIRENIQGDSITFEKAAKEYSDDQMTATAGGFFQDATGALRVASEELDPNIFFTIDTMKLGNISKPIRFRKPNGDYAYRLLYYKDKLAPHQANLEDDYQKIANATLNQKKNRTLSNWFEKARANVYIDIDPEYSYCNLEQ